MSSLWWNVFTDKIEERNLFLFVHTLIYYPIKLFIIYAFILISILPYHFDKIFMQMRDMLFLMRTGDKVRGVYSMGAIARRVGGWFLSPIYFCPLFALRSFNNDQMRLSVVSVLLRAIANFASEMHASGASLNFPKSLSRGKRERKNIKSAIDMIFLQLIFYFCNYSYSSILLYIFKYFYLTIV